MAEVLREVQPFKVKYNDAFHLKNFYLMLHEYLVDEGWYGEDGPQEHPTASHRDIETYYFERHHQKSIHRGGMELWFWWRLTKGPYGKSNNYYRYALDIDVHCMYLQKLDVMHQGKKISVDKGEMEIEFRPRLIKTPTAESWKTHWLLRHFVDMYDKRIIGTDLDKLEKELWREAYRMQATVKSYLNLRNFIPVPEPFHPSLYGHG